MRARLIAVAPLAHFSTVLEGQERSQSGKRSAAGRCESLRGAGEFLGESKNPLHVSDHGELISRRTFAPLSNADERNDKASEREE